MKYSVTLEIDTGRKSEDFDNVDVEEMLGNVVRGMIRQYDLKAVLLKQKGAPDMFLNGRVTQK